MNQAIMVTRKEKFSLMSGVLAASLWMMADMLLVGFVPRPEAYPLFSQEISARIDSELGLLMLDGSPQRLLWGVYFATFSVVFYMLALYGVWQLLAPGRGRSITGGSLLLGYALSPLGHAGFAYIGLLAKSMLHMPVEFLDAPIAHFGFLVQLLQAHWAASVGASAIGWAGVAILTLTAKARLPRWTICFNPVLLAILIILACFSFQGSLVATLIGCASFNIAQLVFFVCALILAVQSEKQIAQRRQSNNATST